MKFKALAAPRKMRGAAFLVCLSGVEPETYSVGGCHSIRLRYRHVFYIIARNRQKINLLRTR